LNAIFPQKSTLRLVLEFKSSQVKSSQNRLIELEIRTQLTQPQLSS